MQTNRKLLFLCLFLFLLSPIAVAKKSDSAKGMANNLQAQVKGLQQLEGFFDLYWNADKGQLLLQIDQMDQPFIYQSSMPRGVGSNDLGLDRGQLGDTKIVKFYRSGPKVLLIEENLSYRANSDDADERAAVENSFAQSVIWGFTVIASNGDQVLVDATDFFLRDSHGINTRLSRSQQGNYSVDASRSAIFMPRTKAFPDNTEVEAIVSYTGKPQYNGNGQAASDILSTVVPDITSFSVHLHHSFIRLPDDNYQPIQYDPRAGIIGTGWGSGYQDYATQIGEPLKVIYGRRHRLEKVDPSAKVSEAVEPIIYYLDRGAPEPVRSALLEGASWWNQAYEAAGYKDAFQVKLLPEDADPMDVRYNVIQWVHRSTRGWSYGSSVVDPRTGEILKGHVTLGSLRVRQDYLIAEGLLAPYADSSIPDAMLDMSLARIRQLSAHEVGHTLGFEHNFAASTQDRASVMDYPVPKVLFDANGNLDLSDAYGVGIAPWDIRTVIYAYQDFPDGVDADEQRQVILKETLDAGWRYASDSDSRNPATANPYGNLWDNGADALEELQHLLKVRAYALEHFSEKNIRPGQPMASLEAPLVPIYLLHRFQIEAVAKLIGGEYFTYTLRGDGQAAPEVVSAQQQLAAIDALLGTMNPDMLALPQSLLDLIPPRPPGYDLGRESFARSTGVTFDAFSPAESAIGLTLNVMMNPARAARMNEFHAADASLPGFMTILDSLNKDSWYAARQSGVNGAIQRIKNDQVLKSQMALASNSSATAQTRAQTLLSVQRLQSWLAKQSNTQLDDNWAASYAMAQQQIEMWLQNPTQLAPAQNQAAPPGSPIGN